MDRLMRAGEVAEHLSVSEKLVKQLTREGRIPCVRISPRVIRYRQTDIAQRVAQRAS